MGNFWIYKILEVPWIYRLSQLLLAPGMNRMIQPVFHEIFSKSKGLVLDAGCGPQLTTPFPDGNLVGLDVNFKYVARYTARYGYGCVSSITHIPFASNTFDEVRSYGVLHHLNDNEVCDSIKEMYRVIKSGGKVVIIDNVWPKDAIKRPIAWLLRRFDRGKWIRKEKELYHLCKSAVDSQWTKTRYTYSYTGLEGVALICLKQGSVGIE